MNQTLVDQLRAKYPKVYKVLDYLECDDGWYSLIDKLSAVIEFGIEQVPKELQHDLYADQIKEKFGLLRFNMNHYTPFITGAIQMAESFSAITCERCGETGKLRPGSWVRALCDKDYQAHLQAMDLAKQAIIKIKDSK